jgi:hypothetical protein
MQHAVVPFPLIPEGVTKVNLNSDFMDQFLTHPYF